MLSGFCKKNRYQAPSPPEKINFNYKIEERSGFFGGSYSWTPKMVFDDGTKTYIQMAATMSSGEAPALFVSDGKEVTPRQLQGQEKLLHR